MFLRCKAPFLFSNMYLNDTMIQNNISYQMAFKVWLGYFICIYNIIYRYVRNLGYVACFLRPLFSRLGHTLSFISFTLPSMNYRLDQTKSATFAILLFWAFFIGVLFSCIFINIYLDWLIMYIVTHCYSWTYCPHVFCQ